ncbi:MAG: AI-2E family transporter [Acidobacteriota bacterium]
MREQRIRKGFLLVLVAATSVAFLVILRSFLLTILMAAVFTGLVYPVFAWLVPRVRGNRHIASAITVLLVSLLVVLPLIAVLGLVVNQGLRIAEGVRPIVTRMLNEPEFVDELWHRLPGAHWLEPYRTQIVTRVGDAVNAAGASLLGWISTTTRSTLGAVVDVVLLLYSMFFLLLDGPAMLTAILHHVPLPEADKQRMKERFVSITRATVKGTVVIGVIQGALAGLALRVAGVPDALFWTVVMMVLSILPMIGGALVWVPACVFLALTGHVTKAVLLAAFCSLIVGSVDNVLRPRLVGRDTKMHDLLILFSTLGGLVVFGPVGVVIGPIVAGLFVTSWAIFAAAYRDVLDDNKAVVLDSAPPDSIGD